jgi:hypothetical protein
MSASHTDSLDLLVEVVQSHHDNNYVDEAEVGYDGEDVKDELLIGRKRLDVDSDDSRMSAS